MQAGGILPLLPVTIAFGPDDAQILRNILIFTVKRNTDVVKPVLLPCGLKLPGVLSIVQLNVAGKLRCCPDITEYRLSPVDTPLFPRPLWNIRGGQAAVCGRVSLRIDRPYRRQGQRIDRTFKPGEISRPVTGKHGMVRGILDDGAADRQYIHPHISVRRFQCFDFLLCLIGGGIDYHEKIEFSLLVGSSFYNPCR